LLHKKIPTSQNGKAAAKQPDPATATGQKVRDILSITYNNIVFKYSHFNLSQPTKKPIKKKTTRKPKTKASIPWQVAKGIYKF